MMSICSELSFSPTSSRVHQALGFLNNRGRSLLFSSSQREREWRPGVPKDRSMHWFSMVALPATTRRQQRPFCCGVFPVEESKQMLQYREAFFRRMEMAGIQPHHRIAIGVSGGADSMALCLLTSAWKAAGLGGVDKTSGYIDGLLAIVVDHGLRAESEAEANHVHGLVSRMGVRCEIARCDWASGKPKQGHLQEAAREMRYRIFQDICLQRQINVLFIAHHSDDQAELFILRLSRNSGVLGLAGMAFMSQLFPNYPTCHGHCSNNHGILLVRPLLDFSKSDLYRICQESGQQWVEDPTNQSSLYARNRIRALLRNFAASSFGRELQAAISACRKVRSFVDQTCQKLTHESVTIMDHGYVIIDLLKLDPSNVEDLCLSKFMSSILQFVSQRHRPVRGNTSKLLLNYIRTFPCKNSLTAAGCYLCAVPRTKGTKIAVCFSHDSPQPSNNELSRTYSCKQYLSCPFNEVGEIVEAAKSVHGYVVENVLYADLLQASCPGSFLGEARKLNLLSELTVERVGSMQHEESQRFISDAKSKTQFEIKHERKYVAALLGQPLCAGEQTYFMYRFLVTWKLCDLVAENEFLSEVSKNDLNQCSLTCDCNLHAVKDEALGVRSMEDTDWMYLSNLTRTNFLKEYQNQKNPSPPPLKKVVQGTCYDYTVWSARRALQTLQSIPVSARRGLPVLVDSQGLLLSIPVSFILFFTRTHTKAPSCSNKRSSFLMDKNCP
ncbi:tRNA(Ile)-lysidine synthase [Nymphaea thermarum]|nr:tRNA(Ile)-lysidine synthase [Nymphaea thermarum]